MYKLKVILQYGADHTFTMICEPLSSEQVAGFTGWLDAGKTEHYTVTDELKNKYCFVRKYVMGALASTQGRES